VEISHFKLVIGSGGKKVSPRESSTHEALNEVYLQTFLQMSATLWTNLISIINP
jgi:hypothetical protein